MLEEYVFGRAGAGAPDVDEGHIRIIRATILVGAIVEGLPLGFARKGR
jgi:hypothetical protein